MTTGIIVLSAQEVNYNKKVIEEVIPYVGSVPSTWMVYVIVAVISLFVDSKCLSGCIKGDHSR